MTWKTEVFVTTRNTGESASAKAKPTKTHDFIFCEYDALPEVELTNIQQVRAVWNTTKNRWELHVICEHEIATESPGDKTAGVNLGICNPAAVALLDDALLYPGNRLRENKHYFQQAEYQTDGPHGPSQQAQWARDKLAKRKEHFFTPCRRIVTSQTS